MRAQLRRRLAATALSATLIGAVLGTAVAQADPANDVAFLSVLDQQGIRYNSATNVVAAGHAVCELLDQGNTFIEVGTEVYLRTDLDAYNAGYFTGAAIGAYCPEHSDLIPHHNSQVA